MAIGRRRTREGAAYHSAISNKHVERWMFIDWQKDCSVEYCNRRNGKEIQIVVNVVFEVSVCEQRQGSKGGNLKSRRRSSEPSFLNDK